MANIAVSRFLRSKSNTVTKFLSSNLSLAISSTSRTRSLTSLNGLRALSSLQVDSFSPPALRPKNSIFPDGRDLKHWLVILRINKYYVSSRRIVLECIIKNLAGILGSVEEAKKRIYSVSTMYYIAYGALLSEELANFANKLKDTDSLIDNIKMVIPDPFVYEGKIEYKGEPFVNGEAAEYDHKYHAAWLRIHGGETDSELEEEERQEEERMKRDELAGVDYEHWSVWMMPPERLLSRDEIINNYVKTLALVVGSEEEARRRIYKVSTRCWYEFGAILDKWTADGISRPGYLPPGVRGIFADAYEKIESKDYGGEPFINGEAVPYDPKYHLYVENLFPELDWFLNNNNNKDKKDEPNMLKMEPKNISARKLEFPLNNIG